MTKIDGWKRCFFIGMTCVVAICPAIANNIVGAKYDSSRIKELMEDDHIVPWAKGGKTTAENCQMLRRDYQKIVTALIQTYEIKQRVLLKSFADGFDRRSSVRLSFVVDPAARRFESTFQVI